jgi:CRP-like cAMP-binding protein
MVKLLEAGKKVAEEGEDRTLPGQISKRKLSKVDKEQLWKQARHILRKVPMFRRAPASLIDELLPALVLWKVPVGTLIIREGESGSTMYLILAGGVQVAPRDHSVVYSKMNQGDFFGEWSVVSGEIRSADVLATKDVELLALNQEGWDKVIMRQEFRKFRKHVRREARERQAQNDLKKEKEVEAEVEPKPFARREIDLHTEHWVVEDPGGWIL